MIHVLTIWMVKGFVSFIHNQGSKYMKGEINQKILVGCGALVAQGDYTADDSVH